MGNIDILQRLYALQDAGYREFNAALLPTVPKQTILGVRLPALRRLAKELRGTPEAAAFLNALPHAYFEENNLHAFLIEQIADYAACIRALDAFLPYVDNWATCDSLSPKVLGKNLRALVGEIRRWLASPHPYTVRFAIGMLLRWYLDVEFLPEYLELVAGVRSEEYYVKMMVAWYFATALAKQYPAALPYLEKRRLPEWTHKKTIQKALESRRISPERKAYLKTLR